jgi:hypothetical protein
LNNEDDHQKNDGDNPEFTFGGHAAPRLRFSGVNEEYGESGDLASGKNWLQLSTSQPKFGLQLAERAMTRGADSRSWLHSDR